MADRHGLPNLITVVYAWDNINEFRVRYTKPQMMGQRARLFRYMAKNGLHAVARWRALRHAHDGR